MGIFHSIHEINVYILETHSFEGKISDILMNGFINKIGSSMLSKRCISFWGDTVTTILMEQSIIVKHNGLAKSGKLWSRHIFRLGYGTYIIHNCI